MKKRYLLTPGPTMVPPEVLQASSRPMIHHRAPEYEPLFSRTNEGLQYVFQTTNPVVSFASSGTGAMEAAVVSILSPGDKAITVEGGKFGERWTEIAQAYGANAIPVQVEWGRAIEAEKIEKLLREHPDVKAVFITHCETSTGVLTDIKNIGTVVASSDAVLVVDAVSSLGAEMLYGDDWKLDIVVSGSQKALMMPPGMAFASISPKARALIQSAKCSKYYFSLSKYLKNLEKNTTPFTPAVSLTLALDQALELIRKEGLEQIWARHDRLARAIRSGVHALGLELFAKDRANVVTSVKVPEGIDGAKIPKILRDDYGITIAGGQAKLKGKIFRIAALGYADTFDVTTVLSALELTLKRLGHPVKLGSGLKAALEVFETS